MMYRAIFFLLLIRSLFSCSSREDCSLNGSCSKGVCKCFPGWDGPSCVTLLLGPTDVTSGLHDSSVSGAHLSTWGGSVVVDPATGYYHMWASRMRGNCGIGTWLSNSEIVHAVSTGGPAARYTTTRVVWPLWAHEPTVSRAPTGEFVMYWSGNNDGEYPLAINGGRECTNCSDGSTGSACYGLGRNWSVPLLTWMSWSFPPPPGQPPDAPWNWSTPMQIPSSQPLIDTNMAGVILGNGSFVGLWRDNSGQDPGPSALHRVTASSWRDPSTYVEDGGMQLSQEDPTIFVDLRSPGNLSWHALTHRGVQGMHAYSSNGGWSWAYGSGVGVAFQGPYALTNGTKVSVRRRERPHFVLDAEGGLVALTNAVQPVLGSGKGGDATFTLVVPIIS